VPLLISLPESLSLKKMFPSLPCLNWKVTGLLSRLSAPLRKQQKHSPRKRKITIKDTNPSRFSDREGFHIKDTPPWCSAYTIYWAPVEAFGGRKFPAKSGNFSSEKQKGFAAADIYPLVENKIVQQSTRNTELFPNKNVMNCQKIGKNTFLTGKFRRFLV
jgi:hypothetical protein